MSELALKRIAENKARHKLGEDAHILDLSICGLKELPIEISELTWIKVLQLTQNFEVDNINPISSMKNLEELYISDTSIKNLSPLSSLKKLRLIYCARTKIENISPISNLFNLQQLYIAENRIRTLSTISSLVNLQQLYFSNTMIDDLAPLANLLEIKSVDCSNTKVNKLQPLSALSNLQVLYCSNTSISDLSALSALSSLQKLDCSSTNVRDISPLIALIKAGMRVGFQNDAGSINVNDCPISSPPIEVIRQGNQAIINYFDEIEKAKKENNVIRLSEAKCLILGEGGAGKTSLAKKLLDQTNPLPEEQATTKGIDVYPHDFKLSNGTDFRLNIWDFGGQEIYHATHQFFLTKRSLYILLDDTRTNDKTVNDDSFNYWLQIAELYGGNSPLLIVQNEKGDRSKQLDLRGMQGRFGFVKDSKATNLLTCRGLEEVWAAIEYWLKQLPHIGEEQPKAWVDIRRELERLAREESRDHIPLEEYYRICAQHEIPERERALFLSSYLHDFGAFLHFQDHPLLRKMLVLNNQWATDGVYRVLNCEDVKQKFGRFNRQDLTRIWADDRYADQHDELLALMEKFELCYKLPDERADTWLAPQLLSVLQPDELAWDDSGNLQIRYEYEFMPKGLLSQHIVRMHRYVRQPDLAWKSGVVFERINTLEDNEVVALALVTEAWGSRNIRIRAHGVQAKELLIILSEDFDTMHKRFKGLKVRKMIPCNCRVCAKATEPHFYEHEDLTTRKATGKKTVECKRPPYEDVSVAGLLDGIFAKQMKDPRVLLADGQIIEALQLLTQTDENIALQGQMADADRNLSLGLIKREEYDFVKNRVLNAALKLA